MTGKTFLGYFLMVVTGLILAAAIVLVALQWGNSGQVTMYGPRVDVNTALLMLCSAAGGVLVVVLARVFAHGLATVLREARRKRELLGAARAAQQAADRPRGGNDAGPA